MKLIIIYEMADIIKAATYCTLKICAELSSAGREVELWVLPKKRLDFSAALDLYGGEAEFKIRLFRRYAFFSGNRFLYALYFICWGARSFFEIKNSDVIFTRDLNIAALLGVLGKKVFYDIQAKPVGRLGQFKSVLARARGVIVKSAAAHGLLLARGYPPDKILLFRNRVSPEEFDIRTDKVEARKKLALPEGKKIVGYAGNFKTQGIDQGIVTILRALAHLDERYLLCLVGGTPENIEEYAALAKELKIDTRVIFRGCQKHSLVPMYLKSFDVLLAPYPATDHNLNYMSPVKLFEYLAAGRPIVVSDLASVREFLDERSVCFAPPADPQTWAIKITAVAENNELAEELGRNAFMETGKYSWKKGAEELINFIENNK